MLFYAYHEVQLLLKFHPFFHNSFQCNFYAAASIWSTFIMLACLRKRFSLFILASIVCEFFDPRKYEGMIYVDVTLGLPSPQRKKIVRLNPASTS